MTSQRKQILNLLNIPATREQLSAKLSEVSDAFHAFRESGTELKASTEQDWKGVHDFMLYIERDEADINYDFVPETDPLTAITAAERYQVFDKDVADTLRADFMKQVQAIVGAELKPAQLKKLFRLCTTYNPVTALDVGDEPKPQGPA